MANNARDYYADLGLPSGATVSEIKAAFHTLARQHHPDKTGANDSTTFRVSREAFEKLTDPDFRTEYDRTNRFSRRRAGAEGVVEEEELYSPTRTEQFAAAEEARRRSPPPYKPKRGSQEPSWHYFNGKAYLAWVKRDQAWRARHPEQDWFEEQSQRRSPFAARAAHGLRVQMSDHPASREDCPSTTQDWCVQPGGQDACIFCLAIHTGGSRCPGCQAFACPSCVREVAAKERATRPRWTSGYSFRTSGGG